MWIEPLNEITQLLRQQPQPWLKKDRAALAGLIQNLDTAIELLHSLREESAHTQALKLGQFLLFKKIEIARLLKYVKTPLDRNHLRRIFGKLAQECGDSIREEVKK